MIAGIGSLQLDDLCNLVTRGQLVRTSISNRATCSYVGSGRTNYIVEATMITTAIKKFSFVLKLSFNAMWLISLPSLSQNADITNLTATPIPGVGHDYIHDLSEIVSPANGSVSIRIAAPTPHERGLNFPIYAYIYDTNGQYTVAIIPNAPSSCSTGSGIQVGGYQCYTSVSAPAWGPSSVLPGGPQYTLYSFNQGPDNGTITCNYLGGYIYTDFSGGRHSLGIRQIQSEDPAGGCQTFNVWNQNSGGDDEYKAQLLSGGSGAVQVIDSHGDLIGSGLANAEDTNGNYRNGTGRTWTESAAQPNGFGPVTSLWVPGFPSPYTYDLTTLAFSFSPTSNLMTSVSNTTVCHNDPPQLGYQFQVGPFQAVKTLTLPSQQSYAFAYNNPYGLISNITYPTGATVAYTWEMPPDPTDMVGYTANATIGAPIVTGYNPNCYYQYTMPAVQTRIVHFDGKTPSLEQDFSYTTKWPTSGFYWTSKQTIVTTKDLLRPGSPSFQTIYSYLPYVPPQMDISNPNQPTPLPLEDTVVYQDYSGSVIKTTKKIWNLPNQMAAECDTLPNGQVSGKFYSYEPYSWGSLSALGVGVYTTDQATDVAEYDYGRANSACTRPSTTPSRETKTTYATLGNTPYWPTGQYMSDRPLTVKEYAGGVLVAETDYGYDQTAVTAVTPGPPYGHDTGAYAANAATQLPRGNMTTVTKKCFVGGVNCANSASTLQYDETGQVVSVTDALGHQSTLSYTDSYVNGTPPGGANSNTYLTTLTRPTTNGIAHQQTFKYDYIKGELTSAIDENGQTSSYQYNDPWNRPTQSNFPDGGQTSVLYNDSKVLSTPYDPTVITSTLLSTGRTEVHESIYDPMGHLTDSEILSDPVSTIDTHTTYDGLGHPLTTTTPYRSTAEPTYGVTTFTYDALGRKTIEQNPDMTSKQWCYNGVGSAGCSALLGDVGTGSWVDYLDELNNHWQRASDSFGNLTQVMEPNGSTQAPTMETRYYYDGLNNLVTVKQWGGPSGGSSTARVRSFGFNSLSQLLSSTNLETGTVGYTYDVVGNLHSKTDARNITTNYAYDALNRLLSKSYSNDASGTPTACFQYDTSPLQSTLPYWKGRLTNQWTQSASVGACSTGLPTSGVLTRRSVLNYDTMGRVLNEQQCTPSNCSTSTPYAPSYTYDLAGNRLIMKNGITTTPTVNTLALTNTYDTAGRLLTLSSNWQDATHPQNLFSAQAINGNCNPSMSPTPAYAPFGALTSAMFGNGLALNRTFDNRLRANCEIDLGSVVTTGTSGSATLTITGAEQSK